MPIVIQELISSDTISQAVDKINFNFDQLILNGGGPVGPAGPAGPTGPVGGRGLRGTDWYKDNTAAPGISPNTIIIPGLEEDDYYLQSNGQVWQYNGTIWTQTIINLTGPIGPAGLSFGFNYAGGFPGFASINNQNAAYPVPMPGGVGSGANSATNQGVSTLLVGAVASNAIPPTGISAFTSAFQLPDEMTRSLDSSVLSTLIHQKDSSSSAIRFMGGGDNASDKYEQLLLSNLANITLGIDDSFNINIPKAATSPVGISDLIGFNLNTIRKGQQFFAGKHINFISGTDFLSSGLVGEISDISFTVNTSNATIPGKFSVSTTLNSASSLFEAGGNITIPATTTKTGKILGEAGLIALIGLTEVALKVSATNFISVKSNGLNIQAGTSPININAINGQPINATSTLSIALTSPIINNIGNVFISGTHNVALSSTIIGNLQTNSNLQVGQSANLLGALNVSGMATFSNVVTLNNVSTSTSGDVLVRNISNNKIEKLTGAAPIPVGGIIMWSGNLGSIPAGWVLCDGNLANGTQTPDLRERFIVGAGNNSGIFDNNYDQFTYFQKSANGFVTGSFPTIAPNTPLSFVINNSSGFGSVIQANGTLNTATQLITGSISIVPHLYVNSVNSLFAAFDVRVMEYRIFSGVPTNGTAYPNFFTFNSSATDSLGTWAEYTKYFTNGIRFNLPALVNGVETVVWLQKDGYDVGEIGGSNETRIAESQLGPHDHQLFTKTPGGLELAQTAQDPPIGNSLFPAGNRINGSQSFNYAIQGNSTIATVGVSKKTGGYQGVENRPPYFALAFIMYVGI